MDALAQVLQQVAPSRWAQAAPLTVVFGYPFARDYALPWPEGITRLRDYQAYAMHHAPFAEAIPGGWQVGFHLPRWGAAAQSYAVPAVQYQTVLALCKETRMRLFAVHTPLSASLAQYRARLPRDCALVVEGASLHCAFVRDTVVTQTFCWPWNAVRPLRDSLTLACALADITLPDTVWIAAARPDNSAVWDEWVWLGVVGCGWVRLGVVG